jgi:hypothetical protein
VYEMPIILLLQIYKYKSVEKWDTENVNVGIITLCFQGKPYRGPQI